MTEREIRTCGECPFMRYGSCRFGEVARPLTPAEFEEAVVQATGAPTWCPLREGPITLRLVEKE